MTHPPTADAESTPATADSTTAAASDAGQRAATSDVEALTFEEALAQLEAIVETLEGGTLSLDESVAVYERGMALNRRCQAALTAAEQRVVMVSDDAEAAAGDASDER